MSSLELLRVFSSFASTETRQAVSLDEANATPRVDVLSSVPPMQILIQKLLTACSGVGCSEDAGVGLTASLDGP